MAKKNWIQGAVKPENKGKLRKSLGVKKGERIPEVKLEKALHSKNKKTKKRAQFAENMKHLRKK